VSRAMRRARSPSCNRRRISRIAVTGLLRPAMRRPPSRRVDCSKVGQRRSEAPTPRSPVTSCWVAHDARILLPSGLSPPRSRDSIAADGNSGRDGRHAPTLDREATGTLVLSIMKGEMSAQSAARKHGLTVAEIEDWRTGFSSVPRMLSFAKTPSVGQAVDMSALIRRESQLDDHTPAPPASVDTQNRPVVDT
jgi:hypothetical protein